MATHSSVLAWRIPATEEPGGLQSKGSQRVEYYFATVPPPDVFTLDGQVGPRSKDKKERGGGHGRMEADCSDAATFHGTPWRLQKLEEINKGPRDEEGAWAWPPELREDTFL
ncbi:unnamed protein product [Rangifer tarandus platyrhynchus]|uniref:Uncharacterized protein n=2 Tax=Rangifer tarandus platyrhynchus TaxID=3082113 RepID=A0ABN8YAI6_RANTA|nr:unnamed protein product [Rangifer tarandus platyrhynchus]